jgi:hypothetical protein
MPALRATASLRRLARAAALLLLATGAAAAGAGDAAGAACSTSTGAATCTIATNVAVSAGTLTVESSPTLYWSYVINGYDQWASGSATALTGCTGGSAGTACSSGTAPKLVVLDGTGAAAGWSVSSYLSSSNLPAGSVLHFSGAGSSTNGTSTVSPRAVDPFASTVPANVCDYGSTCTPATVAGACSHVPLGYSACPSYPVDLGAGTGAAAQVNMYSATAATGIGAICFGSGTASAAGCASIVPSDFSNLGIRGNTPAGTYAATVVNIAVNSGP